MLTRALSPPPRDRCTGFGNSSKMENIFGSNVPLGDAHYVSRSKETICAASSVSSAAYSREGPAFDRLSACRTNYERARPSSFEIAARLRPLLLDVRIPPRATQRRATSEPRAPRCAFLRSPL